MNRRTRLFTLSMVSGLSAAACAAIIGIDDRSVGPAAEGGAEAEPGGDAGADAVAPIDDGGVLDASFDVGIIPDASCNPETCNNDVAFGAGCVNGACQITCAGKDSCKEEEIKCPGDTDCQILWSRRLQRVDVHRRQFVPRALRAQGRLQDGRLRFECLRRRMRGRERVR